MKNLFNLSGKVAIVTGGSGTLGGSISEYLARNGVKVAVLGRTPEKVENRVQRITSAGGEAAGFTADVLDTGQLEQVKKEILAKFGTIDILLNTAGGSTPGARLTKEQSVFDMQIEDYKTVSDLNLDGTVYPSLVFGKVMAENKSGCIINISSMAAYSAITRVPGYSVAKAAIENFTRWMAMEMALKFSDKIRVNAIAPGFFISTQNEDALLNDDGSYTERSKKIIAKTPMHRFGETAELNGTVHYLCSEAASFVTGVIIPVDGGFSSFSGV